MDGSYVSTKAAPGDFDVLLIGPSDIQMRKDTEPNLAYLLDAETAEKERGYSLFFFPQDSPFLDSLRTLWDVSKEEVQRGSGGADMIANTTELRVAVRELRIMEEALRALRDQLATTNPDLLSVTEKAYVRRIERLQTEISQHLCDHPTEVSLLINLPDDLAPAS